VAYQTRPWRKKPGPPSVGDPLTPRELQVLDLIVTGKKNDEVARRFAVSDDTVKFHLKNIFRKLGAKCRTEAVYFAHRDGLVAVPAMLRGDGGSIRRAELEQAYSGSGGGS
jgi:DNA-binding NarL/FixJ family response regulator